MKPCQVQSASRDTDFRSGPDLGPFPASAVAALADLGLSDSEIARYFATAPQWIRGLRLSKAPEREAAWSPRDGAGVPGQAGVVADWWFAE